MADDALTLTIEAARARLEALMAEPVRGICPTCQRALDPAIVPAVQRAEQPPTVVSEFPPGLTVEDGDGELVTEDPQ